MRIVSKLTNGWKFQKTKELGAYRRSYSDMDFKEVRVPHDYAIEGPFNPEFDKQYTAIDADGRPEGAPQTGRTGGLPIGSRGVYRMNINIDFSHANDVVALEFDGVMANASIYVNDQLVKVQQYGYISFEAEITPYLIYGKDNLISVVAEPKYMYSRWYSGAGIYRNVRLVIKNRAHIGYNGIYVTTDVKDGYATVRLQTEVANRDALEDVWLVSKIFDSDGVECAQIKSPVHILNLQTVFQNIRLNSPKLWRVGKSYLYTLTSEVYCGNELLDCVNTKFGVRSVDISREKGIVINGENVKIKGVCMHHDLGALGAAVHYDAIERQLDLLTEMGCNSIRTSHNPPCPELLELCDKKGILVIAEAFDEWRYGSKMEHGYAFNFDNDAENDLIAFIRRDRNHPSVYLWSVGNEILDIQIKQGAATARWLADICHRIDPSRLVTIGCNNAVSSFVNGLQEEMDVAGVNYFIDCYEGFLRDYPSLPMLGTETVSCVSSRGEYVFPAVADQGISNPPKNLHLSSFDLLSPGWGCSPDSQFAALEDNPKIMGEYVWTGFDYIGEPTPFYEEWPSRSSYFGIFDLAGLPKDRYYSYKSKWSGKNVLHIFPHWNWEGMEGKMIPVHCYTSYNRVELFVNGVSVGIREKDYDRMRHRLIWDEVCYTPGELKAVALDKNGRQLEDIVIRTAGAPEKLAISTNKTAIISDGESLVYATVKITDKDGNLCPNANNPIAFTVENGEFLASDAGDQTCIIPFHENEKPTFHGLITCVVRSLVGSKNPIVIKAESDGISAAEICVEIMHS